VVMGGAADQLSARVRTEWEVGMSLPQVLALAVRVLAGTGENARTISTASLEAAVLDRTRPRRTFRRLTAQRLTQLLAEAPPAAEQADGATEGIAAAGTAAAGAPASPQDPPASPQDPSAGPASPD